MSDKNKSMARVLLGLHAQAGLLNNAYFAVTNASTEIHRLRGATSMRNVVKDMRSTLDLVEELLDYAEQNEVGI